MVHVPIYVRNVPESNDLWTWDRANLQLHRVNKQSSESGADNTYDETEGIVGRSAVNPSVHAQPSTSSDFFAEELHGIQYIPDGGYDVEREIAALEYLNQFKPGDRNLTLRLMRRRLAAFKEYLWTSKALRREWNSHLSKSRPLGIIVSAGGAKPLMNAFVMLRVLRYSIKTTLPIVLVHYGGEEFTNATKSFFKEHIPDLEFMDVKVQDPVQDWPKHHLRLETPSTPRRELGYKIKVWALYRAPFRQLIFLDADCTPMLDPAILLDTEPFKKHGSLFWPDFWQLPVSLYRALAIHPDPWVEAGAIDDVQDSFKIQISLHGLASLRKDGDKFNDQLTGVFDMEFTPTDKKENAHDQSSSNSPPLEEELDSNGEHIAHHTSRISQKSSKDGAVPEEESFPDPLKKQKEADAEARFRLLWPYQAETGQLYIDKVKHWDVLEYALFLNTHDEFVYKHVLGDKDTFRVGFALANKTDDYWQSPYPPSFPLHDVGKREDQGVRYLNLGMLQLHPITGDPMFHHRTADAKFVPGVNPGQFLGPITHVTPASTQAQAGSMIFGDSAATIYGGGKRIQWGLYPEQVTVYPCIPLQKAGSVKSLTNIAIKNIIYGEELCSCAIEGLHKAEYRCSGKTNVDQYLHPEPVTVIQVPQMSRIYKASMAEIEAFKLIPLQET